MKIKIFLAGLLLLCSAPITTATDEYLIPTCIGTFTNDYVSVIKADDIDNDGVLDILVGTSINGLVYDYVYKGADCTVDWSSKWMYDTNGDVESIHITDINRDGHKEIIANGMDSKFSGKKPRSYLFVITNNGILDRDEDRIGAFSQSVYADDIDNDNVEEIIAGTKNNKIVVYDAKNTLKWEYTADNPVYYVYAKDIDSDNSVEVIGVSQKYGTATVYVLDSNGNIKWKYTVDGGVYTGASRENIIVDDLDSDGRYEIVVGTYKHGVDAIDEKGKLKWNFQTENLVSTIHAADIDKDGRKELIVGARPNLYMLSEDGKQRWESPVNTTVYSISTADVDNDGLDDIIIGSTRYIRVSDRDGNLKGTWSYKEEIQGLDKVYRIKDANARAIAAGDFDNDNENEIVVGFGWEEDRMDQNFYFGNVRVFELNKEYKTTTTTKTVEKTTTTVEAEKPTTTVAVTEEAEEAEEKGKTCVPFLPGLLTLALSLLMGLSYVVIKD